MHQHWGSNLESGLGAFFLVEEQLWDAQRLHAVYILNVVKALAKAYVPVDALAHPQRQCPVFALEQYYRDVCQAVVHVVLGRQPGDDRFVVCQKTHRAFRARRHIVLPHLSLEHNVVMPHIHRLHPGRIVAKNVPVCVCRVRQESCTLHVFF